MCASCGCDAVNDQHGNGANITLGQIEKAAAAAGISSEQAARNMENAVRK